MSKTELGNLCGVIGCVLILLVGARYGPLGVLCGIAFAVVVWIARAAQLRSNDDGYANGIVEYRQPRDEQEREEAQPEAEPFRITW